MGGCGVWGGSAKAGLGVAVVQEGGSEVGLTEREARIGRCRASGLEGVLGSGRGINLFSTAALRGRFRLSNGRNVGDCGPPVHISRLDWGGEGTAIPLTNIVGAGWKR
eukprot:GFKZ01001591.1.p3 GENE.GFKZ01001591.1~~GFKZ01001591.1.p3  ORF type:complete len:108 (-),score=9.47 GFKZ01001591.1:8-331(-)